MQILGIIALITVPLMLYVKPIIENNHEKKKHAQKHLVYEEKTNYAINERESLISHAGADVPIHDIIDLCPEKKNER